jgi:hypothetical protein
MPTVRRWDCTGDCWLYRLGYVSPRLAPIMIPRSWRPSTALGPGWPARVAGAVDSSVAQARTAADGNGDHCRSDRVTAWRIEERPASRADERAGPFGNSWRSQVRRLLFQFTYRDSWWHGRRPVRVSRAWRRHWRVAGLAVAPHLNGIYLGTPTWPSPACSTWNASRCSRDPRARCTAETPRLDR